MKKIMFTLVCFAIATVFWFFDSAVHYFIYGESQFEAIPSDFNEMWMRSVIVLLIIIFGIFSDYFINNIVARDKQLEVARIYNGMIHASLHILVNLLNQMQLFKLEAQKSKDFDQDIIKYYDKAIDEASNLVTSLSRLHEITESKIGTSPDELKLFSQFSNSNLDNPKKPPE